MPARRTFNPPPNWPAPPPGWQPPAGWEPDPTWGPAPPDWELFRRANPHPFLRSLGIATLLFVVVRLLASVPLDLTAYDTGGLFATLAILPGLATGLLLRSRASYWPWWKVLLSVLAWAALFAVVQAAGNASPE